MRAGEVESSSWIDQTGRSGKAPPPVPLTLIQLAPPLTVRKTWPVALKVLTTAKATIGSDGVTWISLTRPLPAGGSCSGQGVPRVGVAKILLLVGEGPPGGGERGRCGVGEVRGLVVKKFFGGGGRVPGGGGKSFTRGGGERRRASIWPPRLLNPSGRGALTAPQLSPPLVVSQTRLVP